MMYAEHESKRCGSDYTMIAKDLKTVSGFKRRLLASSRLAGKWTVYSCSNERFYHTEEHKRVGEVVKV